MIWLRRARKNARMFGGYLSPSRDFDLPLGELVEYMGRPSNAEVGAALVERIEDEGEYRAVFIKGIREPLYWPRAFALGDLYLVIAECFDETHWHQYQIPETRVEEGDVVLDCGAAEGIFALSCVERAKQIGVFEPSPVFCAAMRRTFHNRPNVSVVPMGVSDMPGTAYFEDNSIFGHFGGEGQGTATEITTIDAWVGKVGWRVNYIKADVEGFELKMLKGAQETIRRDRPKLALTMYHTENNWRETLALLHSLVPTYKYRVKGLAVKMGVRPMMIHLWE